MPCIIKLENWSGQEVRQAKKYEWSQKKFKNQMTWRRMAPLRANKHCSGYNLHLGKSLHRYLLEVQRIFRARITQHMLFSMCISSSSQHTAPGTIGRGAVYAHQLLTSNVVWPLQNKVQLLRKVQSDSTRRSGRGHWARCPRLLQFSLRGVSKTGYSMEMS